MKKKLYILVSFLALAVIGLTIFFHKTQLQFELVCKVDSGTDFRPDAYTFIHSEKLLKDYLFSNKEAFEFTTQCGQKFDFNKYSYVIVCGWKPKLMYYSYKSTWFDDKSAYYAPHWGSKVVFIEYENESEGVGTFVYRIDKQEDLRGFFGI